MKRTGNRTLKWMLLNVKEQLASRGWVLESRPSNCLKMLKYPGTGIEHRFLMMESGVIEQSPPAGYLAVTCHVFVSYVDVETLINQLLGYEQVSANLVSAAIRLNELAPMEHLYDGRNYLIELEPGLGNAFTQAFLADVDHLLEPLRLRLSSEAIFFDEEFVAPGNGEWGWAMRRLAHMRLHGLPAQWQALAQKLERSATQVLDEVDTCDSGHPGMFTKAELLVRDTARHGAQEALRLITALRTH